MEAESFFQRWSRRKTEEPEAARPEDAPAQTPAAEADQPPPTLEDVAQLTPDSDFTPFVARGVDENVRRSAMKKLFADPRFNVMDGLDIYIDDYNKFEPLTPAMLAMMNDAQALLNPTAYIEKSLMGLLDSPVEQEEQRAQNRPAAVDANDAARMETDVRIDAGTPVAAEKNTETTPDKPANDDAI